MSHTPRSGPDLHPQAAPAAATATAAPADGFDFLLLARRREIAELDALASTSRMVVLIGRLIHELQRERGAGNVYLGSNGQRFAARHAAQVEASRKAQAEAEGCFAAFLAADATAGSSRLFGRLAVVVQELQALAELRARIAARSIKHAAATAAFSRLIAGLLEVVFEAVDGARSPAVSRILLALFNFMQGKELAGQERAVGSGCFAAGRVDAAERRELTRLIDAQEHCFRVFAQFAPPPPLAAWQRMQQDTALIALEQLRRLALTRHPDPASDGDLGERWFECCTHRIDLMQAVEAALVDELRAACDQAIAEAQAVLEDQQRLLADRQARARSVPPPASGPHASLLGADSEAARAITRYGAQLERSMLDMLLEQTARLQEMGEQLALVRSALDERKLIERAKGVLMAARGISEAEAYGWLRQMAMSGNRRLVDTAAAVLSVSDCLKHPPAAP
ncbi:MAG: nitrate- and nitrite sensing domain-containing protein [Pseudoxanthomonas sp.]